MSKIEYSKNSIEEFTLLNKHAILFQRIANIKKSRVYIKLAYMSQLSLLKRQHKINIHGFCIDINEIFYNYYANFCVDKKIHLGCYMCHVERCREPIRMYHRHDPNILNNKSISSGVLYFITTALLFSFGLFSPIWSGCSLEAEKLRTFLRYNGRAWEDIVEVLRKCSLNSRIILLRFRISIWIILMMKLN